MAKYIPDADPVNICDQFANMKANIMKSKYINVIYLTANSLWGLTHCVYFNH